MINEIRRRLCRFRPRRFQRFSTERRRPVSMEPDLIFEISESFGPLFPEFS
jgi:hypothetical protein